MDKDNLSLLLTEMKKNTKEVKLEVLYHFINNNWQKKTFSLKYM